MEIMTQKFILDFNAALAMENAGVDRLQTRVTEASLPEVKSQLEHHLQESKEHQERLQHLIKTLVESLHKKKLDCRYHHILKQFFKK